MKNGFTKIRIRPKKQKICNFPKKIFYTSQSHRTVEYRDPIRRFYNIRQNNVLQVLKNLPRGYDDAVSSGDVNTIVSGPYHAHDMLRNVLGESLMILPSLDCVTFCKLVFFVLYPVEVGMPKLLHMCLPT